ncbi:hypothetical protein JZ751_000913, partial [Albula glossodonta]
MEGAIDDKRLGEGINSDLGMDTELSGEKDSLTSEQTQEDHAGKNSEGEEDGGDGVDLSSINSMMSTVMNAGPLNGGSTSATPTKTPTKSPSINRMGRK